MASEQIHVCILTTAHPIDDVRVNQKFARSFLAAGFRVSWVGPNHAFFELKNFKLDEIEFFLVPPNQNRIDRLLAHRRIREIAKTVPEVDVFYSPDPDAAQIAVSIAKKSHARVIFDIHEIYHGALLDRWLQGFRANTVRQYIRRWIARIASECSLVIGVSESVLTPYVTASVPSIVVRSCAPLWFSANETHDMCKAHRRTFTVMHGKSDLDRGTLKAIEAAALSYKHVPNLRIVMFESVKHMKEDDTYPLISRIKKLGVRDVIDLRPRVPMQDMPRILQECSAGLILYNSAFGQDSLPNRLFEYMASGLAIIAPFYAREIARIIESEQCGMLVDCENATDIANAIVQLSRDPQLCYEMGNRARKAYLERHNWAIEVQPVIKCIKEWCKPQKHD